MNGGPEKRPGLPQRFRNWISLSGLVLAVSSMFSFVLLFALELFSAHGNPYLGILTYVVAPAFFFLGAFLILLGGWIQGRRAPDARPHPLTIDFSRLRDRRILAVFIVGAIGFLLLSATGSYQTFQVTESNEFCGLTCHTPMKPEYTAYLSSPHARVACVECHVGPGATWYVKSKINGVHQLYGVITGDFHRPILTPIKNLRPAQETCERCHWPEKFAANLDRSFVHFLADETNTPFTVRLLLKIGGGAAPRGIHWHMNPANKIEYLATDEQRQIIPWVRLTTRDGTVTEYRTKNFTNSPDGYALRTMDCLDCHNRPAHRYQPPNDAVDLALSLGKIDNQIPWVKSNLVSVLVASYPSEAIALQSIDTTLRARYPDVPGVPALVSAAQEIFRQNFFPEMKADWRVYPDNLGHKNWPGCFRCHDGAHKTDDGKKSIAASDCNACHLILAQGSGADLEKLNARGHDFFHLDSTYLETACNQCHTGAFPK
jgi:hypothetical protein